MGDNERINFGRYIEQLRKIRGKSLRETGKAIGVSPQFYSEVEKGRRGGFHQRTDGDVCELSCSE